MQSSDQMVAAYHLKIHYLLTAMWEGRVMKFTDAGFMYFICLGMCMSQEVATHRYFAMQWEGKDHGRQNFNRFIKIMVKLL